MGMRRRVSKVVAYALVVSLFMALGVPVGAVAGTVPLGDPSITGIVTDADTGLPIEGIEVWLEKSAAISTTCFSSTVTGADGRYTFSGIPSGYNYWIKVNAQNGYGVYESDEFPYSGTLVVHDVALDPVPLIVSGLLTKDGVPAKGYKVKLWRVHDTWEEWVDYLWTESDGAFEFFTDEPGTYHLTVYDCDYQTVFVGDEFEFDGVNAVAADIDLGADAPERLADDDRFSTAVQIAREGYDPDGKGTWPGVKAVVLAAGDDRAAADPLSAAGLCGALEAPLFLVSKGFVPTDVKRAVKEIVTANGPVTVYIVGGKESVPDERFYELKSYVGVKLALVRVAGSDRYATAEKVAYKVKELAGAPDCVLIANGADASKFFDALSLSPIAAAKGFPILLVSADSVPSATKRAMGALKPKTVIVGGGTKTVSEGVRKSLGGERWASATRYSTATSIAGKAMARGWLDCASVGIASKLPDALTGGSLVGGVGGVLIITDGGELSSAASSFLENNDQDIKKCFVLGGAKSMTPKVQGQICEALALDSNGK